MIKWIIEQIVGVKLNRNNFNPSGNRILSCLLVIVVSYLILGPLFPIIDNLVKSSGQAWYTDILTKYSFVAVSIRIIFLSLFTRLNNPFGRFKASFSLQLIGFVGGVVIHSILNDFIIPSTTVDSTTKLISELLPFLVNIVIFVAVRQVYQIDHFDEREFFKTDSRI